MVTVITQVYNTQEYLKQCIESVLKQTFPDFEYILIDNGCTDHSKEIMEFFAQQDSRIKLIQCEYNTPEAIWIDIVLKHGQRKYLTVLDSDDWWEPDYLERLLGFLERNRLDLAVTGAVQYLEISHTNHVMRRLRQAIVMTQCQFAQNYPSLWTFPSTTWGSIMKMELFRTCDFSEIVGKSYPFGFDTMAMLQYINQCSFIGIDDSALYHYRIRSGSVSYQYNPRRFDANIACYEQIRNFLVWNKTLDSSKQEWLYLVHLSSMIATLNLLKASALSDDEKIEECARIVEHPLTSAALTNHCNEREQWFGLMWGIVLSALAGGKLSDCTNLNIVLHLLAPQCCGAVQGGNLNLFAREPSLQKALREDNREQLMYDILELISKKQYTKQYNLGQMLHSVMPEDSLLRDISDIRFFREYAEECAFILKGQYLNALDRMTGLLLQKKKLYKGENFLELYLTLSALMEHESAFLFGKLQLAQFYLKKNCLAESRGIVDELTEIGMDSKELDTLRCELEAADR